MASASRFTSPPMSPPRRTPGVNYPTTPQADSNIRNRSHPHQTDGSPGSPNSSDTATTHQSIFNRSTTAGSLHIGPSGSTDPLSSLSNVNAARKVTIRSDPTMLTCFDPADQELYKLWVPIR
ncbi:hypothetical protein BXZ70DRAFT_1004169 [Cristinia sonorae]|uniref:Uncharacterized protein n=1 Tax=Cristinia sonorae TaxID=1940300 RepID=A0A8K0XTS9_9AGAR|nr:hypothetical protein BXZ70DRAFT_1004169 [Cristinia sonorae]